MFCTYVVSRPKLEKLFLTVEIESHKSKFEFSRTILGATSEYPATHALLKSTATVVRGPQSASKVICMY